MDDAAIVGMGVVGKATALAFGIKKYFDLTGSNLTLKEVADCRYVFICLPTPTVDGKCDTSLIRGVIRQIEGYRQRALYIIRSTVIPSTADAIMDELDMDRVISNPEFLSEDNWEFDARKPQMVIIGARDRIVADELNAYYLARYKYLEPLVTDNVTAEMIKYAFNTFYSLKVVFANELYDICQRVKANYGVIQGLLTAHPWGSGNHFVVNYKGKRGVNGRCLPKDLEAFVTYSNSRLLKTVKEVNDAGFRN